MGDYINYVVDIKQKLELLKNIMLTNEAKQLVDLIHLSNYKIVKYSTFILVLILWGGVIRI